MILCIVLLILTVLYIAYIYKIVKFLDYAFNKYFIHFTEDEKNVEEKYRPYHRKIRKDLPKVEIYLCAIFLAPFRIFNVILILLT